MFENFLSADALLNYFIFASAILIPMFVILKRAGLNRMWAGILYVPYTGLFIVMGVLAFKRWPVEPPKPQKNKNKNKNKKEKA